MFPTTNFKQFDYILKIEKYSLTFKAFFHPEESKTGTNEKLPDSTIEVLCKSTQFKKKSECSGNRSSLVNGREKKRIDDFIG